MIEKTSSVIHDKKIKRILEYNEDAKQITIGDQRFYQRKDKTYKCCNNYYFSSYNEP